MDFDRLSEVDKAVIGQILRAAADGPFFPDWEFHTLFGLQRAEVRTIADEWPLPTSSRDSVAAAVNGSFNNLLGYPHRMDDIWSQWITVERGELQELFTRLGNVF